MPARSCLIDGEAIVCDETGPAVFDLIRGHRPSAIAVLCAFDLLELDGEALRKQPIEGRKRRLAKLLRGAHSQFVLNEDYEADDATVYREACKLGCEGIVSKRIGSLCRAGRSNHWIKVKNLGAPAVKAKPKRSGHDGVVIMKYDHLKSQP